MSGQHRPKPLPVNQSTRLGYNPDQQQSYPPQSTGYNVGAGPAGRHNPMSSRDSYPTFLSIGESITLQLRWAWCGLWDAFRWNVVWRVLASDPEIRANVLKSFMLNSLSLISIYTFELVLQPLVRDQERWLHRNLGWFYHVMWLLPVLGMAFYLNSSWCTLIARRTFTLQHGSRVSASTAAAPPGYTGMLKQLATSAYRVVMVFTSLLVSFSLGIIPYVGPLCGFVFFCWIDAYYCFEFVWIARGMSLSRRVRHLEERWAYYLAFGLPATAICMLGTGLASAALFALVYPTYIILAMHASPKPLDPYNPTSSEHSSSSIRHPSPFIPIRVPVFGLVIWLNDAIVRVLSVGSSPTNSAPGMMGLASPQGKKMGYGRGRALSDVADSVEEGGQWEAVPLTPAPGMSMGQAGSEMQMQQQQQPVRQAKTRERVMLSRRKAD